MAVREGIAGGRAALDASMTVPCDPFGIGAAMMAA